MDSVGKRVKWARERRGLSRPALAKLVGGITHQAIEQLEKGDSRESRHTVRLAAALGVSAEWLATGKGTADEGREWEGPHIVSRSDATLLEIAGIEFARLPVHEIRFAAGAGSQNYEETPVDYHIMSRSYISAITDAPISQLAMFEVDGDSMEETLKKGDWVLLDLRHKIIRRPAIYGLLFEGEGLIKRAERNLETGSVILSSDNPRYKPQEIKKPDRLSVVGKLVLSIRRH